MKTSTTSTVLQCTPHTFWASFLDESYLRALYLDELQYRALAVLEISDASRKLRIVPKMKLPAPVRPRRPHRIEHRERATDRSRQGVRDSRALGRATPQDFFLGLIIEALGLRLGIETTPKSTTSSTPI